jgi:type VI secretion system secreted protein Hcp
MTIFPAMLVSALAAPGDALADTILAQCTSQSQGTIAGDATMQNFENWMNVFGFGHGLVVSRVGSGQASGRRDHQPLRLYKAIDKATPKLYRALVMNESVDCVVRFFRNNPMDGTVENYFTIEVEDAFVSDITAASGSEGAGTREVVSVVYQQITWTYEDGGITFTDQWTANQ